MVKKDPRDRIGEVYAVHTIYGDCLMQTADVRYISDWADTYYYVVRVFKTRYQKLPDNITEIVQGDHDFIVDISEIKWFLKEAPKDAFSPDYSKELKMRGITDNRTRSATLIGKFDVPAGFKKPLYFKNESVGDHIPRYGSPWPPLNSWEIYFENPDKNACTRYASIPIYEWVTKHLRMNFNSDKWYPYFVELGPGPTNGLSLIEMLEDDFSLDMWLPSDFEWKNKKYFKPSKEWIQLMKEKAEREKERMERYRLQEEKYELLKSQGIVFDFRKTQEYKDFIKLVKE